MARHIVAKVNEIAPGRPKRVEVAGRQIALFNVHGEIFALADRCPHEGASLCRGQIVGLTESDEPGTYRISRRGEFVRCPWHGWEFDLRTGRSWCDPARVRTKTYDVSVESGGGLVEGPFSATVFPVSTEDDYVVVDL